MNEKPPDNAGDIATGQIVIKMEKGVSATVLQHKYTSVEEAIGAISRELIKSGRPLMYREIQLMLVVRLMLASERAQQNILREALMLIGLPPRQ